MGVFGTCVHVASAVCANATRVRNINGVVFVLMAMVEYGV